MKRFVVCLLAACGSSGEATVPDAVVLAQPTGAELVQLEEGAEQVGQTSTVAFAPTTEHSLLVVAIMAERQAIAVTTSTGRRLELDLTSQLATSVCDRAVQIWAAGDVEAGITSVEVELRAAVGHAVTVFEVAGLSRFPLNDTTNIGAQGPAAELSQKVGAGNFVIAALGTCGTTVTLAPGAFTALPSHFGAGLGYQIPTSAGDASASWTFDPVAAHALSVAYR